MRRFAGCLIVRDDAKPKGKEKKSLKSRNLWKHTQTASGVDYLRAEIELKTKQKVF